MRVNGFRTTALVGLLAAGLPAYRPLSAAAEDLRGQLLTTYPLTVMDPTGIKVAKPGLVLQIRQPGIQANNKLSKAFPNIWEDGKITAKGIWNVVPGDLNGTKILAIGDKAYLLKVDIKDESVTMTFQTCGSCNPAAADPSHKPHFASIQFKFIKNYLTSTDMNQIQTAIGVVLAPVYTPPPARTLTSSQSTYPDPPPTPQDDPQPPRKFEELTPPPPPQPTSAGTAPPPTLFRKDEVPPKTQPEASPDKVTSASHQTHESATADSPAAPQPDLAHQEQPEAKRAAATAIDLGDSRQKVDSLLGNPDRIDKSRGEEICVYGKTTITFVKGKVAGIVSQ